MVVGNQKVGRLAGNFAQRFVAIDAGDESVIFEVFWKQARGAPD
jgi:hypothetical protein